MPAWKRSPFGPQPRTGSPVVTRSKKGEQSMARWLYERRCENNRRHPWPRIPKRTRPDGPGITGQLLMTPDGTIGSPGSWTYGKKAATGPPPPRGNVHACGRNGSQRRSVPILRAQVFERLGATPRHLSYIYPSRPPIAFVPDQHKCSRRARSPPSVLELCLASVHAAPGPDGRPVASVVHG